MFIERDYRLKQKPGMAQKVNPRNLPKLDCSFQLKLKNKQSYDLPKQANMSVFNQS